MMALAISLVTSCSDDDPGSGESAKTVTKKIEMQLPADLESPQVSNVRLTVHNISSGAKTTLTPPASADGISTSIDGNAITLSIPEGLYNLEIDGDIAYTMGEEQSSTGLRANMSNVTISETNAAEPLVMSCYLYNPNAGNGFVIAEFFYANTLTPEGERYSADSYVRIVNNSDETLYADGLVFAYSEFQSDMKEDYRPNIISEAVSISTAYRIPGNGTEHPVAPGGSILLVDNGIDHREANPNSFDLSHADFEWYDISSNPDYTDIDSDVPNLEPMVRSSATVFTPHVRGVKTILLCRLGEPGHEISIDEWARDYYYEYTYDFVWEGEVYPMGNYEAYKIPNSWVIDCYNGVQLDNIEWLVVDPSLDRGYSYTREQWEDAESYGKCVRRKTLPNGKLQDTNDSRVDFLPKQVANPYFQFN